MYSFVKKKLCVCHHIGLHIERTKEYHKKESQLLLSLIEPHKAISTSTVSCWIIEVLGLAGIDTKTLTVHSKRSATSSKAKMLGVPPKKILRRGHWSKAILLKSFTIKKF